MSGYEEAAAWSAWEAYAAEAAAAATAAEGAGAGAAAAAAGGAAAGGLTAAELAALEASAAQGLGGAGELSLLGDGAAGLAGSGGTAADASLASTLSQYGAGNTVTDSLVGSAPESTGGLLSDPSVELAADGSGNAFTTPYDEYKYKALNALNKAGGAYNKLPKPVQGLLASQAMGGGTTQGQPMPSGPARMPQQGVPPPQMQPTYNAQPYQSQNTASKFGQEASTEGLLANLTPQQLEMLKRMLAQGRM